VRSLGRGCWLCLGRSLTGDTYIGNTAAVAPRVIGRLMHVRFPPADADWLAEDAEQRGVSVAELLRRMVRAQRLRAIGGDVEPISRQIRPGELALRMAMSGESSSLAACRGFVPRASNGLVCSRCGYRRRDH
jgi:hypothetical protein